MLKRVCYSHDSKALSTRIGIRLYSQTFYCGHKTLRVHTYPDLLRFRPSTCIRIRSEFDTKMLKSLIEHALMNKLNDYHGNAPCEWAISALLRHRFEKFTVTSVHTYPDSLRFQKFAVTVCVFAGYVWTKAGSVTKCLWIQTNPVRVDRA